MELLFAFFLKLDFRPKAVKSLQFLDEYKLWINHNRVRMIWREMTLVFI